MSSDRVPAQAAIAHTGGIGTNKRALTQAPSIKTALQCLAPVRVLQQGAGVAHWLSGGLLVLESAPATVHRPAIVAAHTLRAISTFSDRSVYPPRCPTGAGPRRIPENLCAGIVARPPPSGPRA